MNNVVFYRYLVNHKDELEFEDFRVNSKYDAEIQFFTLRRNYFFSVLKDFNIMVKNEKQLYATLNTPSKDHGDCVNNYKEAKKRAENIDNIDITEKEIINAHIDLDIIIFFEK